MVQRYREMADDPIRMRAFKRAIAQAVRPGAVVLDAGCGLGTYAVLAAQAGAARVYAVDEGPILEVARQVVADNGCAERVRLLRGRTTLLEPPERADVVIFEDYVAGLLLPQVVQTVADLRARWLKPDGVLLPGAATIWIAPVESSELRRGLTRFDETAERVAGVDLGAARRYAMIEPQHAQLRPASVLSTPASLGSLALGELSAARLRGTAEVEAHRDGRIHGIAVWFALALGDTVLGTGPLDAPSAWRQVVLPVEPPLSVREGERITLEVDAGPFGESLVWRWRARTPSAAADHGSLDLVALVTRTP